MVNNNFKDEKYWSDAWERHIYEYLKRPPRCGLWINSVFRESASSILECAGGSCRDSRYLNSLGYDVFASDFDDETISYLKGMYANESFMIGREDAFSFSFDDKSFDLVFSNGFWVLFGRDEDILRIFKEHVRVASRYAVVIVHNSNNKKLVNRFFVKSQDDDLYNVRFFSQNELRDIVDRSGVSVRSVRFEKFGGPFDKIFWVSNRIPVLKRFIYWLVPRLYKFQRWSAVERIAMIVSLK